MELHGTKINFLGDSITEGYGLSDLSQVYWKRLELNDGAVVRGYGIGGTSIAPRIIPSEDPRHNRFFGSRVADMNPDADAVVVFGGTNDFGYCDAPFGCMTDRIQETFYGALHLLCLSLIEKYPAAQLMFMTPLHRSDEHQIINERGVRYAAPLGAYVDAILEVTGYYGIPVLDLYRVSGIQPVVPLLCEAYTLDGLHPNAAGHERIYRKLRNFLTLL